MFAAIRLNDGRLVVGDNASRKIRVFGPDGAHLVSVGGEGEGPGEYRFIAGLWQSADSLFAYDRLSRRITVYGLDNPASEPRVSSLSDQGPNPPFPIGRLGSGELALAGRIFRIPESGFAAIPYIVTLHGAEGALIDTIARWETGRMGRLGHPDRGMAGAPMFEAAVVAAAGGDQLVVSDCRRGEYRQQDIKGVVKRIVRWPTEDRKVSDGDIEAYRADYLEGLDGDSRRLALERLQTLPANDRYPACDALALDDTGRVWVRVYAPPGGDRRSWLVFDSVGRPLLEVDLPMVARFASATEDHLVVIEPDALDVEHVRVYQLP